jgi:hypothetical protein
LIDGRSRSPSDVPLALTAEFGEDPQKNLQWNAFMKRVPGEDRPALPDVVGLLQEFLWPALQAAGRRESTACGWSPGGPWTASAE